MTILFLVFLCLDVIDVGVRAMVRVTHKTCGQIVYIVDQGLAVRAVQVVAVALIKQDFSLRDIEMNYSKALFCITFFSILIFY
ncbi:uncharacterized protein FRV6_08492 [Fusarium oxysporum]|uniref:Secreted protein n=1 Tax=Fusarium oxysporum TaxID=5507 RepID=A0A2H3T9L3_FUSOX|nr:uncharacterized protein FRV6_08492 [Fusarium oxysporum]